MSFIEWSAALSVGVECFDQEHRELVELLNRMEAALRADSDAAATAFILHEIYEHTDAHFAHEEREMERTHYPRAEEHKRLHTELLAQAQELASGAAPIGVAELLYLRNWLLKHVQTTDRRLGRYLVEHGAYPALATAHY